VGEGTIVYAGWGGGGVVLFIVFSYQIKYWLYVSMYVSFKCMPSLLSLYI
jgi:hypothetical protein